MQLEDHKVVIPTWSGVQPWPKCAVSKQVERESPLRQHGSLSPYLYNSYTPHSRSKRYRSLADVEHGSSNE